MIRVSVRGLVDLVAGPKERLGEPGLMHANVVICMQGIIRHSCAVLKAVRCNYSQ